MISSFPSRLSCLNCVSWCLKVEYETGKKKFNEKLVTNFILMLTYEALDLIGCQRTFIQYFFTYGQFYNLEDSFLVETAFENKKFKKKIQ